MVTKSLVKTLFYMQSKGMPPSCKKPDIAWLDSSRAKGERAHSESSAAGKESLRAES